MIPSMEEQLKQLNSYQLAAVKNEDPVCLVNANVGSGKTRVLVTKTAYLHEEKQIPFHQMMILTFTNKAAGELKERLSLSEEDMPLLGTFHHAAMTLLKEYLDVASIGFTKEFELILPEEELALANELIARESLKIKYKNRLAKRLESEKRPKYKDELPKLRELLKEEKQKKNVMSYEDLMHFSTELLSKGCFLTNAASDASDALDISADAAKTSLQISFILVDEVQDCDETQLDFLRVFMDRYHPKLFAVGDPSQSIYSFRAGHIQVFYRLKSMYHGTELNLPINYRSNATILEAAKYFQQNGNPLEGVDPNTNPIRIQNHYDPLAEAAYLADRIRELHEAGIHWEEIAVFYRLSSQRDMLEKTFLDAEIPLDTKAQGEAEMDPEKEELVCGVHLMTLHASKGLEFDCVFIIGVNDGLLPIAGGYEQEEEERRLFYVGMTRARKQLELSYYTNPGMPGVFEGEGRFLRAIPPKLTERSQPVKPAVSMQELKRLVEEEKKKKQNEAASDQISETHQKQVTEKRVLHPKYGEGTVVSEDDTMIHVNFDAYGEKSFLKMLSELTDI